MNDTQDNSDLIEDDIPEAEFDTGPDNAGVKILPPFIFLGFFALAVILEIFMGVNMFNWGAQLTIGILLISLGAGVLSWCFALFTEKLTNLPPNQPTTTIITVGPYMVSRNPIYLAMICVYLGLVVVFDVAWGLPLALPLVYIIRNYVIAREEDYLSRKFGKEYTEYCLSTRRWL